MINRYNMTVHILFWSMAAILVLIAVMTVFILQS